MYTVKYICLFASCFLALLHQQNSAYVSPPVSTLSKYQIWEHNCVTFCNCAGEAVV
jgi:hypothetical protein